MKRPTLTRLFYDRLVARAPVESVLKTYKDIAAVQFDEEQRHIVITLLKPMEGGERQEVAHRLLYALIGEAATMGFPLAADHFRIEQGTGAAGSNPLSSGMSVPYLPATQNQNAWQAMRQAEEKAAQETLPHGDGPSIRTLRTQRYDDFVSGSLAHHAERLGRDLGSRLGRQYQVSYGVSDGKPVINITTTNTVQQVIERFFVIKPMEHDPEVARAIMQSFHEVLKREPRQGEIIIGDNRQADVSSIRQIGKEARTFGAQQEKNRGERGIGGMGGP